MLNVEEWPCTQLEAFTAPFCSIAAAIEFTLRRISLAAAGLGTFKPKCLSNPTTNCSASTESNPRLPGPNNDWSSAMSSAVICSMRFSTIMPLTRSLRVVVSIFLSGLEHKHGDVCGKGFSAQARRERGAYPEVDL